MTTLIYFPYGVCMAMDGALPRLATFSYRAYNVPPYNSKGSRKYMTTPCDSHVESNWQGVGPIKGYNLFYIGLIDPQPIILQDQ